MLLELDHHSGVPIYRQVIEQIRRQILSLQLTEGQKLMSARELAEKLKVNPMTISKAYSLLEMEGLLKRKRGLGLFVAGIRKEQQDKTKITILQEILNKAAVTAVQMDVPEETAQNILRKLYKKYNSKKGSGK